MANRKITRKLPSFDGVGASQTATLKMPIGFTYETLFISYSGITLAQMTGIRVMANGKPIRTWRSGTELDNDNQQLGYAAAAGILIIPFTRPFLDMPAAREMTAIGTGMPYNTDAAHPAYNPFPITTLHLEIDCAGGSTPVLSAIGKMRGPEPTGYILKTVSQTYDVVATGEKELTDFPRGEEINRVLFHTTATNFNSLKIEVDNYAWWERTKAQNDLLMPLAKRRANVSALFCYDTTEEGLGNEGLPTRNVNDMRFVCNFGGTPPYSLPTTIEYIGVLIN